jgi:hypothetical protein
MDMLFINEDYENSHKSASLHYLDIYFDGWLREDTDAYRELLGQLEEGLTECDDNQCEICEEALSFKEAEKLYQGERLA